MLKSTPKLGLTVLICLAVAGCNKGQQESATDVVNKVQDQHAVVDGFKDMKFGMTPSQLIKTGKCVGIDFVKIIDDSSRYSDETREAASEFSKMDYDKFAIEYVGGKFKSYSNKFGSLVTCHDTFMSDNAPIDAYFDNASAKAYKFRIGRSPNYDGLSNILQSFEEKYGDRQDPSLNAQLDARKVYKFANGQIRIEVIDVPKNSMAMVDIYYLDAAVVSAQNNAKEIAKGDL